MLMPDPMKSAEKEITTFLKENKTPLDYIASTLAQMFEIFCLVVFLSYYRKMGLEVEAHNLVKGKFRFRHSPKGYPWNFSYFTIKDNNKELFEIRHNLTVAGAWKAKNGNHRPFFAVDIAVVKIGSVPTKASFEQDKRYWIKNDDLITFGEAKSMAPYPMLIAGFIGIVNEITPQFLQHSGICSEYYDKRHPKPTIFTNNLFTFATQLVIESAQVRNYMLNIMENVNRSRLDSTVDEIKH